MSRSVFFWQVSLAVFICVASCELLPPVISFDPIGKSTQTISWERISGFEHSSVCSDSMGINNWIGGSDGLISYYNPVSGLKQDMGSSQAAGGASINDLIINASGTRGWGVCDFGRILKFVAGEGWKADENGSNAAEFGTSLSSLSMNSAMTLGWAVGDNGSIVRYDEKLGWDIDLTASQLVPKEYLESVSVNSRGDEGFAVGRSGTILRLKGNKWSIDQASKLHSKNLTAVSLSSDGSFGWAVGNGVVLKYQRDTGWQLDESVAKSIDRYHLEFLEMNSNCSLGHAIGPDIFLSYERVRGWQVDSVTEDLSNEFTALSISKSGNSAFLVGANGIIFKNDLNLGWKCIFEGTPVSDFNSAAINKEGTEIWAVGEGITHFQKQFGHWKSMVVDYETFGDFELSAICMNDDFSKGCIVGSNGIILDYSEEKGWRIDTAASLLAIDEGVGLNSLVFKKDFSEGWAGGRGLLHFQEGRGWLVDRQTFDLFQEGSITEINSISMNSDFTRGIAGGSLSGRGVIFLYDENTGWQRSITGSNEVSDFYVLSIQMNSSFLEGWALGRYGRLYRISNNVILKNETRLSREYLSISFNDDGTKGWAVSDGLICRYHHEFGWEEARSEVYSGLKSISQNSIGREKVAVGDNGRVLLISDRLMQHKAKIVASNSKRLLNLEDSVLLKFPFPVYDAVLAFGPNKSTQDLFKSSDNPLYQISLSPADSTLTIFFARNASQVLDLLRNKEAAYRLKVKISEEFNDWTEYRTESFFVGGPPVWQNVLEAAAVAGFSYLLMNLFLVVMAVPSRWFRENVFNNELNDFLGLFSLKGTITKPLLIWIRGLKHKILSDYRNELLDVPYLSQWRRRLDDSTSACQYIPPQIGSDFSTEPVSELWLKILSEQKKINSVIWFVLGRSGLGKSALLENIALKALAENHTPIVAKLSMIGEPAQFLSSQFEHYGHLSIDAASSLKLVKRGSFVIILDGLNEAKDVESIRLFIKSILKNNIVIVSSQFEPDWVDVVKEKVFLQPFGKKQLLASINNEEMVEKLARSIHLLDFNSLGSTENGRSVSEAPGFLPITAALIAKYVRERNVVPNSSIEIYSALFVDLQSEHSFLNFELLAWKMFRDHLLNIKPEEEGIDSVFLVKAKRTGVLSETTIDGIVNYRFKHERIFSFFVAYYLSKKIPVLGPVELHSELTRGQSHEYWVDVADFLGEILLYNSSNLRDKLEHYKRFVFRTGQFSPVILRRRLIPQWYRFCDRFERMSDAVFESSLLSLISQHESANE